MEVLNGEKQQKARWTFIPLAVGTFIGGYWISGFIFVWTPVVWQHSFVTDWVIGSIVLFPTLHLGWMVWRLYYLVRERLPFFSIGIMLVSITLLMAGGMTLVLAYWQLGMVLLFTGMIIGIPNVVYQLKLRRAVRKKVVD